MSKQDNLSGMIASIQAFQKTMPAEAIREFAQYSRSLYTEHDTPTLAEASEELAKITANSPKNNPAKWAYEHLIQLVKDCERELDNEHEIGLTIVSLGNTGTYYIQEIDYWSPYFLVFHCLTKNGVKAILIQHHSQLNFLLTVLPKQDPKASAKRIGFCVYHDEEAGERN